MEKNVHTERQKLLSAMLKDERLSAKLTQEQLAKQLSVPQSFVAKYELGERRLDILELFDVLESIGADKLNFIQRLISKSAKP
jgi:transcriptional regulator with XRE-family HTH domain